MVVQRGEIWWASLPVPVGAGPGFRRPVLVVSADAFNKSRIQTCIVAVITSNMTLARAPGNVHLPKKATGLNRPSVVNVSQVLTVDKTFLTEKVKMVPEALLDEVDQGLKLVLGFAGKT